MLAALLALALAAPTAVVSTAPCDPMRSRSAVARRMTTLGVPPRELPGDAEDAWVRRAVRCERLTYRSDGLRVVGYLYQSTTARAPQPVILFARGGNREFGALPHDFSFLFAPYLRAGFAVLATQYRGNDGGEGREQFGGADLDDLLNLRQLVRALPGLDDGNVFVLGESRGGMMALMALRRGLQVNAAAVNSAPTDLVHDPSRAQMSRGVYQPLIPGFAAQPDARLEDRSAGYWPQAIQVPLLILQGTRDSRVPMTDALELDGALGRLGRAHRLAMFPGDEHLVRGHFREAAAEVVRWFRAHRRPRGG